MTLVGWVLVAGFVAFMVGAGGWRVEYEQQMDRALPLMHADRGRLRWIHRWMVVAMFLTVAGLGGLVILADDAGVAVAVTGYAVGALAWVGTLLFRLGVGEWAAEETDRSGAVPAIYPPMARSAGYGHFVHMTSAYASAILLGWSLSGSDLIPGWLTWAGPIWGAVLLAMFLVPRTRFVAAPPFWAHVFTFAIGLSLLT